MGMEGLNKDIKKNHTFKNRVGLGQLFEILNRMLGEWSENPYEHLLEGDRLDHILEKDLKDGQGKTGLARKTDGWKFAYKHRKGSPTRYTGFPLMFKITKQSPPNMV